MAGSATTLAKLLSELVSVDPQLPLYRFLEDGESESDVLDVAELHRSSLAIAHSLLEHCQPGDRVLLLAPPGLDFVRGFFAIQYAGLIGTTSFAPHPRRVDRTLHRIQGIVASCQPKVALTTSNLKDFAGQLSLPAINIHEAQAIEPRLQWPIEVAEDSPAFLQYTSGSTREPRGVVLTHRNMLANLRFIQERFGHTRESVGVIWLPPYHDMGLIGGILQPLYAGFPVILLNPLHVIQRPVRWLKAITRYRATTSGGPNFAFDLCASSITDEQKAQLDLSSWQVAFCGAEAVRPATWRRFSTAFEKCGFRREAFFPCYGLAEATLMVTSGHCLQKPQTHTLTTHTSSGQRIDTEYICLGTADHDHVVRVAAQDSLQPVVDGDIGEICVTGPSVSNGYWNSADQTESQLVVSDNQRWLRTGDLGFISHGALYVTGRCKELIILDGRNLYPQDLELAIEQSHAQLLENGSCVFSLPGAEREQLVALCELRPGIRKQSHVERAELLSAIRRALTLEFDVRLDQVIVVRPGALPRTSSGKKRRHLAKEQFEEHRFAAHEVPTELLYTTSDDQPEGVHRLAAVAAGNDEACLAALAPVGIHVASASAKRLQQRLALLMVVTPILGLVAAIVLTWGEGIQAIDLCEMIGLYLATVIGIEVGFHRHFSHRSFQAVPIVRAILCILGSMAAQGPLLFWVATHRRHHAYSDQADDPHSPVPQSGGRWAKLRGLVHAHVGWLFSSELTSPMHYGPDILRERWLFRLSQYYPAWVALGLLLPALGSYAVSGTMMGLLRGFLWGGLVRIFLVHHATWSVNSICHSFGWRAFETRDQSRNNVWLVPFSLGGSWHNNHHAFPNSAYTGFNFWQADPSGWLIYCLGRLGLAWDVKNAARPERVSSNNALPIPPDQLS